MRIDAEQIQELITVSRMYYFEDLNQSDIARQLHISRSSISRMLKLARESGVVKISIEHPFERTSQLERALMDMYGLDRAWVCEAKPNEDTVETTAKFAASILPSLIERESIIGLSNGTMLAKVVDIMPVVRNSGSYVVQMIGSLGDDNQLIDSPDISRRMAEKIGGTVRAIPAPLIVGTARLAATIKKESSIEVTLNLASRPDIALVGIGASDLTGSGRIFNRWMTPQISEWLAEHGAVGHILGHHYNIRGEHIESPLCARTIGVPLERLRQISSVVGIASGPTKINAIQGAFAGGYLKSFITDESTAKQLLAAN